MYPKTLVMSWKYQSYLGKIGQAQIQFIINIEVVHTRSDLSRFISHKETEQMNSMSSIMPILILLLQFTPVA